MMAAHAPADQIISLERAALDRWGSGDPGGFLDLYAADISYFDPLTAARLDGRDALTDYYRPWIGKIHVARYEMVNPQVVVDGDMALLTYNLVNYDRDKGRRIGRDVLELDRRVPPSGRHVEIDPFSLVVHAASGVSTDGPARS